MSVSLEVRKGKARQGFILWNVLEGMQPWKYLDFGPVKPVLDS